MKKILYSLTTLLVLTLAVIYFWPARTLTWQQANGVRWANLSLPWSGSDGFELLSAEDTRLHFSNTLTEAQIAENQHLLNGSGVATGDINGDGLVDIYLCRLDGPNALYKNLGDWRFEDITASSGVACSKQFSTGTALADIDGDYDLDLLVTTLGGPHYCFLNDGTGTFTDVTQTSGLIGDSGATTMALADIDSDNDLDLYVANYKKHTVRDLYLPQALEFDKIVKKVDDGYEIVPEFREHYSLSLANNRLLMRYEKAEPDRLYLNDGTGFFHPVSFTDGRFKDQQGQPISEPRDWGLTVRFQDLDQDGDADIIVCNDFESPDRIWINDGSGYFRALSNLAVRNVSWATMGVDFSDIDRDGDLDFYLLDMLSRDPARRKAQMTNSLPIPYAPGEIDNRTQNSRNTLFLNRGDRTYAEIAQFSGVHASGWSWSPLFFDVDLDGYEDIIIGTGHFYDALDFDALDRTNNMRYPDLESWRRKVFQFPPLELANVAFRNRGDLTFEDISASWGFESEDICHGAATADLDNDGDLDLIFNRLNAPVALYRNTSVSPRIAVRLRGLAPNTQGIGAKIQVLGGAVAQSKEIICGGAYLSGSDPLAVFAADEKDTLTIDVRWPNGSQSVIRPAFANRIYEIDESTASGKNKSSDENARSQPYFEDVSNAINHTHHENDYDDFQDQPLLPKKLSQLGPGVAWFDLDGDGFEDLFIGSGRGGSLSGWRNDGNGGFQPLQNAPFNSPSEQDRTALLGWITGSGTQRLLVGASNWEDNLPTQSRILMYGLDDGTNGPLPNLQQNASVGPMTMSDYDLDGDLDLFVGGRFVPKRYPEPASSWVYRNEAGSFELDSLNSATFQNLGVVSAAVFSDVDADGDGDLVLAVEWGPVMVFRNDQSRFVDITEDLGLDAYLGWWQGVTTGDFNEDGKMDIVATNWGLNNKYQDYYDASNPLYLVYDDLDNNGTVEVLEASYNRDRQAFEPLLDLKEMSAGLPYVRKRMSSYQKYSQARLQEIVGFKLKQAATLEANTLAHMVFLNQAGDFTAVPLPAEAQFSPAFYAGVSDFDGDGHDDIFLTQNFFALPTGEPRYDAGRGLWLKGDGTGQLEAVPGQKSGIKVYGEQRGAALCDYDHDGRVDLVVSQNGAATKLYRNVAAKQGLRVRLIGPAGNRQGAGAAIRVISASGKPGPTREVHLGSGYWSQDSSVQIFGLQDRAETVWVRWPGGRVSTVKVPEGAAEITVAFSER